MTTIDYDIIRSAIAGLEAEATNGYSGRGMYGRTCFGVTFDSQADVVLFFLNLADAGHATLARELAEESVRDSMGLGQIVYFPRYELSQDFPDEV